MTSSILCILFVLSFAFPARAQDATPPANEPEIGGVSREEAMRLRALGYLDYSPERSNLDQSGVRLVDTSRAAPGNTLVVSSTECAAQLIDLSGERLHSWRQQDCVRWWSAELLRNGDLVVVGGRPASERGPRRNSRKAPVSRFSARIGRQGELVWLRDIRAHHQVDWTPSKEVLLLTESIRPIEEVSDRAPELTEGVEEGIVFHDNALVWLDEEGGIRQTLSLFDAVTTGPVEFDFRSRADLLETSSHVGLFHANSAAAMDHGHLEARGSLFSKHNVLVTSRNQNRIFVVNRETRSLIWVWGRGELEAPHFATWLANGHILVFDNGVERKTSRVLEVDPVSGRIVWQYPNGAGVEFHSETRGVAQRLTNDNTLITNSQAGEVFEVTSEGKIVWRYWAPALGEERGRPVLMSVHRYAESWSAWLDPTRDGTR